MEAEETRSTPPGSLLPCSLGQPRAPRDLGPWESPGRRRLRFLLRPSPSAIRRGSGHALWARTQQKWGHGVRVNSPRSLCSSSSQKQPQGPSEAGLLFASPRKPHKTTQIERFKSSCSREAHPWHCPGHRGCASPESRHRVWHLRKAVPSQKPSVPSRRHNLGGPRPDSGAAGA